MIIRVKRSICLVLCFFVSGCAPHWWYSENRQVFSKSLAKVLVYDKDHSKNEPNLTKPNSATAFPIARSFKDRKFVTYFLTVNHAFTGDGDGELENVVIEIPGLNTTETLSVKQGNVELIVPPYPVFEPVHVYHDWALLSAITPKPIEGLDLIPLWDQSTKIKDNFENGYMLFLNQQVNNAEKDSSAKKLEDHILFGVKSGPTYKFNIEKDAENHRNIEDGDSGAPLMLNGKVIGIYRGVNVREDAELSKWRHNATSIDSIFNWMKDDFNCNEIHSTNSALPPTRCDDLYLKLFRNKDITYGKPKFDRWVVARDVGVTVLIIAGLWYLIANSGNNNSSSNSGVVSISY